MLRWVYNLLFPVAFVAMLPGFLRRMVRRGNYRRGFGERFGWYSAETRRRLAEGEPRPWIQAVSVGEMLVALKLINAWRESRPGTRFILSTTTTTGMQLARERAGEGVEIVYTPVDSWAAVRRAYAALRPCQVVVVDGGLWPNLLCEARARGLPTALVNARLSPRSERRFRRIGRLTRFLFASLDLVCVPEPSDVERWISLGVPRERVACTGSIKFDDQPVSSTAPAACLRQMGVDETAPVWLAASTHPGEERIVAEAFCTLRKAFPGLFLVLAPRHVERTREVLAELVSLGLTASLRSAPAPADVLVLDVTGELREWPGVAAVVFVGKSLAAVGGQNPAESAALGRPVIFGPHMENFEPLASALVTAGAAVRIGHGDGLAAAVSRLLEDPAAAAAMGARGREALAAHRGAARRTVERLKEAGGFSSCH